MKIRSVAVLFFCLFGLWSEPLCAAIANVPPVLTAPMIFYDEGGNVLADGSYGVMIKLKDAAGTVLYAEEQVANVVDGAAALSVGLGFEVGSNYAVAAAGLALDVFQTDGDVMVEITVAGQSTTHTAAVLGSQPYAFVAEYAIGVAPDAVTSSAIADGVIVAADLDPTLLSSLQSTLAVDTDGEAVTAANITVASDIGLNNSGAATVHGVLQDLDSALESLRDIDLAQSLENVAENYLNKDGSLAMTADLDLGGHDLANVGLIGGVDVAVLRTEVSDLDGSFATDGELTEHAALTAGVHGLSDASALVGTTEAQNLQNKILDDTNSVAGEAIDSGIVDEAFIDEDLTRDAELIFENVAGTLAETQIPAEIARDDELTFENLSGTLADAQIPTEIVRDSELSFENLAGSLDESQIPSEIVRDSELTFGNLSGSLSDSQIPTTITRDSELLFSNLSGALSDAQIPATIARVSELSFSSLSGTISESQLPSGVATDSEVSVSYLSKTGDTLNGTLTIANANIIMSSGYTVDGVDVSALSGEVSDHESRIDTLEDDAAIEESEVPAAIRPFAYGSFYRSVCTGYNMDSDCTFTTNASNDDYYVVLTPQGSVTCGSYAGECHVSAKASTGFTVNCTCPGSGSTWNTTVDFLVFAAN